jgi:LPXTG-motif cell wall-anchored protein
MGALDFAMPGLVVFAATLGWSFILLSGTARFEAIGERIGPTLPETAAPSALLMFFAIVILLLVIFVRHRRRRHRN